MLPASDCAFQSENQQVVGLPRFLHDAAWSLEHKATCTKFGIVATIAGVITVNPGLELYSVNAVVRRRCAIQRWSRRCALASPIDFQQNNLTAPAVQARSGETGKNFKAAGFKVIDQR